MRLFRLIYLSFIFFVSFSSNFVFSMNSKGELIDDIEEVTNGISDININNDEEELYENVQQITHAIQSVSINDEDFYQSDSEDEADYIDKGYEHLEIPEEHGPENIVFFRGIHFARTNFSKQRISEMKRKSEIGKSIISSAVYDLNGLEIGDYFSDDEEVLETAEKVKQLITQLNPEQRNRFQKLYTNQYNKFHAQLRNATDEFSDIFEDFDSSKNPQVSTSEFFRHAGKYAFGQKFLGEGVTILDPEYDQNGKAKHPYLGKIYIILVDTSKIKDLDPYFVVHAHAKKEIKVSTYFTNDILSEREVSFPGFIPGKYIVFEKVVRVPSRITGEYKKYYETKYGLKKQGFTSMKNKIEAINNILKNLPYLKRKDLETAFNQIKDKDVIVAGFIGKNELSKKLTEESIENLKQILEERKNSIITNLIENIIKHLSLKLEAHVKKECSENNISIVYKKLEDGFCDELPKIDDAKKMAKA